MRVKVDLDVNRQTKIQRFFSDLFLKKSKNTDKSIILLDLKKK
jgi:hypothetical protein